ncbi:MAG: chromate transporter, partial [Proteobacteria bacterium]
LAATLGMFLAPTALAALAAAGVKRFAQNRWVRAFSAGAAPAIVGLLGATLLHSAQQSLVSWHLYVLALAGLLATAFTKINPVWILLGGAFLGWIIWLVAS